MGFPGRLKLVTAPATALITTAEAKLYLRVDDNGEDALIDSLVTASTNLIEEYCNRKFITQTWAYFLDSFGTEYKKDEWWDGVKDGAVTDLFQQSSKIKIPLGPMQSVTHLKTYGDDDVAVTMDSSDYGIDTKGPFGQIALRNGATWPSTVLRRLNGIEIEFVVGYGSAANVPQALVQAVKEMLASMYERRGDSSMKISMTAMALARPYRVENL